jgi:hypothetical protein
MITHKRKIETLLILIPTILSISNPSKLERALYFLAITSALILQFSESTELYFKSLDRYSEAGNGLFIGLILPLFLANHLEHNYAQFRFGILLMILSNLIKLKLKINISFAIPLFWIFLDYDLKYYCLPIIQTVVEYKLIQILRKSVTFGESMIISFITSSYLVDSVDTLYNSITNDLALNDMMTAKVLSYSTVFGMLFIGFLTQHLLFKTKLSNGSNLKDSVLFLFGLLSIIGFVISPLVYYAIKINPFVWTFALVFDNRNLFVYWLLVVSSALLWASKYLITTNIVKRLDDDKVKTRSAKSATKKTITVVKTSAQIDLSRKFFHILVLFLFIPGYFSSVLITN